MANGRLTEISGLRIAGLGGTLAPTMYEVAAAELPHPKKGTAKATEAADRRRHFVREEVEACKGLRDVDVFLSHEAPRPFRVARGIDAGKTPINEVLSAMHPRLHLFGHHHRFTESRVADVPSVCLDLASVSYLLIDANTLIYQHLPA
jgi:Icc-related predicted phosphoesterase